MAIYGEVRIVMNFLVFLVLPFFGKKKLVEIRIVMNYWCMSSFLFFVLFENATCRVRLKFLGRVCTWHGRSEWLVMCGLSGWETGNRARYLQRP